MKYGTEQTPPNDSKRARGTSHNAAVRGYGNYFDLATEGGTAEPLVVGVLGPGCVLDHLTIESDVALGAINFQVGTEASPAKYGAALAGPAANAPQLRYPPLTTKLDATEANETIILTPSAAMPAAGKVRVKLRASHR